MKFFLITLFIGFYGVILGQSDTELDVHKGSGMYAQRYSMDYSRIVILLNFGDQVDEAKRKRVMAYIDTEMYKGENEAPVSFFIGGNLMGEGVSCSTFIDGKRQRDPSSGEAFYTLTQYQHEVEDLVGVYNLVYFNKP